MFIGLLLDKACGVGSVRLGTHLWAHLALPNLGRPSQCIHLAAIPLSFRLGTFCVDGCVSQLSSFLGWKGEEIVGDECRATASPSAGRICKPDVLPLAYSHCIGSLSILSHCWRGGTHMPACAHVRRAHVRRFSHLVASVSASFQKEQRRSGWEMRLQKWDKLLRAKRR